MKIVSGLPKRHPIVATAPSVSLARARRIVLTPAIQFALAGGVLIAWLALALTSSRINLVIMETGTTHHERRLVGAVIFTVGLTLLGMAQAARQPRLRWVALAAVVLALGTVLFGDVLLETAANFSLETGLYGLLLSRAVLVMLIAVGLVTLSPPLLTMKLAIIILSSYVLAVIGVARFANSLPSLTSFEQLPPEPPTGVTPGFTTFYWGLSAAIALLALMATIVAARRHRDWEVGRWIVFLMILLSANVIHTAFRPSTFGINSEFTSANVIMTMLIVVNVAGCTFNMRAISDQIAADRDALAEETKWLADLERLRTDFTTMVAHELAQPLLAIRRTAEVLQLDDLPPEQTRAIGAIATEVTALFQLIDDVRASATAESEDFSLRIERSDIDLLFDRTQLFAETLPNGHHMRFERGVDGEVWADAARIDQVLRNLLSNADRYTTPATAITVRAVPVNDSVVRFEVEDEGPGIDPDQLSDIFEKYRRGATDEPGLGVGLYLSRRILQRSGSDLQVRRGWNGGACFWFDLPRVSG